MKETFPVITLLELYDLAPLNPDFEEAGLIAHVLDMNPHAVQRLVFEDSTSEDEGLYAKYMYQTQRYIEESFPEIKSQIKHLHELEAQWRVLNDEWRIQTYLRDELYVLTKQSTLRPNLKLALDPVIDRERLNQIEQLEAQKISDTAYAELDVKHRAAMELVEEVEEGTARKIQALFPSGYIDIGQLKDAPQARIVHMGAYDKGVAPPPQGTGRGVTGNAGSPPDSDS